MTTGLIDKIKNIVGEEYVLINEPMYKHTTFKVGGEADLFVTVNSEKMVTDVIELLRTSYVPYYIIGNGSNLLVSDSGYRGAIIEFGEAFSNIEITPYKTIPSIDVEKTSCSDTDCSDVDSSAATIYAEAGALIVKVANEAYKNGFTGLEFASGIPGSLGGAIYMNAGAYGGEMKDIVKSVKLYNIETGKVEIKNSEEMQFSYRHSVAKDRPYVVLGAELSLKSGEKETIKARMDELKTMRVSKQPLEFPSAGSTFKRPEGYFAGKLIEDSGLKGYSVGGAQVSEKHSGFVVNKGNATASDVYQLIKDVQAKVMKDSGVMLEPEVIMLGDFEI